MKYFRAKKFMKFYITSLAAGSRQRQLIHVLRHRGA